MFPSAPLITATFVFWVVGVLILGRLSMSMKTSNLKLLEIEFTPKDLKKNSYYMKPRGDAEYLSNHVALFNMNQCPHAVEGNLLKCLIPSDGVHRHCVDEGQVLVKLVGFARDGRDIEEITSQNVVFMGSIKDPGNPKLVDCQILGSNNGTGFRSLADLIMHCKPSNLREELLSPSVRSFLRCLRNETGVDSWIGEKMKAGESVELLYHPVFLDYKELQNARRSKRQRSVSQDGSPT
ncbi:uncharacterized protein LOC113288902 isoform X4 [Papaver somniferum]|uniref:uncharacterized protein LOC113288902 isoform X4 n=1 Tax=Papaver somniferum TaxID=3469 RepID=UPI000E6FA835|nr:uncharacterized protein LOC113288902 isoform X4 [Papaver somniferum]